MRAQMSAPIQAGDSILTEHGPVEVIAPQSTGLLVRAPGGQETLITHAQVIPRRFQNGTIAGVMASLYPLWDQLDQAVRDDALFKLECVNEVNTGYRRGVASLALEGEPFYPFGPGWGVSLRARYQAMARLVSLEKRADRVLMRRVYDGEVQRPEIGLRTLQSWGESFEEHGLRGLIDGRALRKVQDFGVIDVRYRQAADEVFGQFDGEISAVNQQEIQRRIYALLRQRGQSDVQVPDRLESDFLRHYYRRLGKGTRAHRSRSLRKIATTSSAALHHPGYCASDVTRADNLVTDEYTGKPISVEICTIISVPTRVVVALRVFPRSVTSFELGLVLYDAMRPFSMVAADGAIDDWRWCGVPTGLEMSAPQCPRHVKEDEGPLGVHYIPAVTPVEMHTDHGSTYISDQFRTLLQQFGITLSLTRGGRPTDNPHIERFHETLQRAYQQLPGYKGRNVSERGSIVGVQADEPLLTARQLEAYLRAFVAVDYHRRPHTGLIWPGTEEQALTPLEMFDAMLASTGRLHYPQHPDLIYQFLPIRWLTIRHAGIEYKNMAYDAEVLDEFRDCRAGAFRDKDAAAPFHYDPRDTTRLWFRHPETDRIHEIPWRGRHLLYAPMVEIVRDQALAQIRRRAGRRHSAKVSMLELIDEIGQLATAPRDETWAHKLSAARMRWDQGQRDHDEVAHARALQQAHVPKPRTSRAGRDHLLSLPGGRTEDTPPAGFGLADLSEPWPDYPEEHDELA